MSDPSVSELPQVWRASELACAREPVLPTGYAALDAVLPGGGWPVGGLSELLQAPTVHAEWSLLAPCLARLRPFPSAQGSAVRPASVLIGAPHLPFGPALAAQNCDPAGLLQVCADTPADRLWAAEQALRCAEVQAVVLWIERVALPALRRLQSLAQSQSRLLFVCRPHSAHRQASPAPLRLALQWSPAVAGAAAVLEVEVLKRRGPPLSAPVRLQTSPATLRHLLAASHAQALHRRQSARRPPAPLEVSDALDRAASLA